MILILGTEPHTHTSGVYTFSSQQIPMAVILQQRLNLTINLSTTSVQLTVTECDTYTWNGTTYILQVEFIHLCKHQL